MANEAVRTRQYREYLDADKTISRQIYNLYQRQEAAYKEGPPSIRNQNQLAPISGVIEAVNALQSELQNLMSSATNNYFKFTTNNFVPVIKAYNSLVFALRSIQNIYKRNVQIKYEVDKLLKPVIEIIQSVASQLAYDPAVSNRLFQMRTNLLSKVFERIDYNVGKRILKKIQGEESIATYQPGSDETLDTFQQPVMEYKPENNDPFLGKTPIKSEAPATFEGLDVAGFDLNDEEKDQLRAWKIVKQFLSGITQETLNTEKFPKLIERMSNTNLNAYIDEKLIPYQRLYDAFPENVKKILERNKMQSLEEEEAHMKKTLAQFRDNIREQKNLERQQKMDEQKHRKIERRRLKKGVPAEVELQEKPQESQDIIEFDVAEDEDDEVDERTIMRGSPASALLRRGRSQALEAIKESPKTIIRRITQPVDEMTVFEMVAVLKSANAWNLLNQKNTFLPGKKYEDKAANAIEKYKKDPIATVDYFKNTLNIDIPLPSQKPKSSSKGKPPQLQSTFAASPQQAPTSSSSSKIMEKGKRILSSGSDVAKDMWRLLNPVRSFDFQTPTKNKPE